MGRLTETFFHVGSSHMLRTMCVTRALLLSAVLCAATADYTTRQVVYGKYFSTSSPDQALVGNQTSRADQTYWLYSPKGTAAGAKLPVHIQIHGGGFTGGAAEMQCRDDCQAIVGNGMHYMSVGYRLVATKYYY